MVTWGLARGSLYLLQQQSGDITRNLSHVGMGLLIYLFQIGENKTCVEKRGLFLSGRSTRGEAVKLSRGCRQAPKWFMWFSYYS